MRQFTLDAGFFTVTDIQKAAGIPRSTAQDWVMRLVREGCVLVKRESGKSSRPICCHLCNPSKYLPEDFYNNG